MRKQLFILSSELGGPAGPSSSILLDGAAGDYFKSKDAWLPQKSGALNSDTYCDFTISWWAKNTKPEGNANADNLWTIFAVASDETDTSGNLVENHDDKGFSLHCYDNGDGDLKIRLHIRNNSSLSVVTGDYTERGDTQVYSYDVVPDNNAAYNTGFPFDDTAGRFDELFNDGEWHLYEVCLANSESADIFNLSQYSVKLTVDTVDIRPSNITVRFDLNAVPENSFWDPGAATPSIQRAPFRREGTMPTNMRLWMGTLYGDDGIDAGTGAMSMQLYSIIYASGWTDGASRGISGTFHDRGSPSDGAHGATAFPNNAFNNHYYHYPNAFGGDGAGARKIHGLYTQEHGDNTVAQGGDGVLTFDFRVATQWWRPGFDKDNIGRDYMEFLGGGDTEGRVYREGSSPATYHDSNAIRYSDFEVHGMTAASIRRDAPGGFGDDSSILLGGTDSSAYFKSAASLSDVQASTIIWWAKNTTREGPPDTDGLWTIFSIGTALGDRNSFSLRCTADDEIRLYIRDHLQAGGLEKIISYDDDSFHHAEPRAGLFDELFNDGEWHMYAVAIGEAPGGIGWIGPDEVVFSIDGVEIPSTGSAGAGSFITRGTFRSAPQLWMGTNFGGAPAGNGSTSMQLYSIIYAEGFASTNWLLIYAYNDIGDVVDAHWPAFNSVRFPEFNVFTQGGRIKIPPLNWWRPGYDETEIGKDYEGSADFDLIDIAASDIVRDYPNRSQRYLRPRPYSSVLMDGDRGDVIYRNIPGFSDASSTIIWWAKNTTEAGGTIGGGSIQHTIWSIGQFYGARNSYSIGWNNDDIRISVFNDHSTVGAQQEERVIQYNGAWHEHFEDDQWHMYAVSILQDGFGFDLYLSKLEFTVDGVLIEPSSGEFGDNTFRRGRPVDPALYLGSGFGLGPVSMQLYSWIYCYGYVTPTELLNVAYNEGNPTGIEFPGIDRSIGAWGGAAENWLRPGFDKDDMFKDHPVGGPTPNPAFFDFTRLGVGPTASDVRDDDAPFVP